MKKIRIAYLSIAINIFGCAGCDNNELNKQVGQITIIINNIPKENSIQRRENKILRSPYDINYLDDRLMLQNIFFNESRISDTINIQTQRTTVEVSIKFNGVENANYLFHNGDTVVVEYSKNIPFTRVVNRKYLQHDIDFDNIKRGFIYNNDIPTIKKISIPHFFSNIKIFEKEKLESYKDSCLNIAKKQIAMELQFVDSFFKMGYISKDVYDYRRRLLLMGVYNFKRNGVNYENKSINHLLADTLNYLNPSDTLLYYSYYRAYLNKNIIIRLKKIPFIRDSNSNLPDYCIEFDSIARFNFLSEKARKYFLIEKLRNILDECSSSEIEKYQAKFRDITGDTTILKFMLRKYNVDLSTKSELYLIDINSNKTFFDSIVANHKKYVLYVDFWASWCAPCRESMPFAKKLREEFQGKKVAFIYLAYNDQEKAWKGAIPKLGLDSNCENYLITNPKTSKMLEALKVTSIPRYMLFNKNGKLVDQNAPGPEGEPIRKEINKLLEE